MPHQRRVLVFADFLWGIVTVQHDSRFAAISESRNHTTFSHSTPGTRTALAKTPWNGRKGFRGQSSQSRTRGRTQEPPGTGGRDSHTGQSSQSRTRGRTGQVDTKGQVCPQSKRTAEPNLNREEPKRSERRRRSRGCFVLRVALTGDRLSPRVPSGLVLVHQVEEPIKRAARRAEEELGRPGGDFLVVLCRARRAVVEECVGNGGGGFVGGDCGDVRPGDPGGGRGRVHGACRVHLHHTYRPRLPARGQSGRGRLSGDAAGGIGGGGGAGGLV